MLIFVPDGVARVQLIEVVPPRTLDKFGLSGCNLV
jgi:hypothetical protein